MEAPDAKFETLADAEGFDSLDAKLAAALAKLATGHLGRRMTHAIEVAAKSDAMVGGRQLLHIVYNHYKISDEIGLVYNFSDLMAVKLRGDNALEGFLLSWDSVLDGMSEEPSVMVK